VEEVDVRRSPSSRRWRLEAPWGEPARLIVPRSMSQVEVEEVLRELTARIAGGGAASRKEPALIRRPTGTADASARLGRYGA
jgi:hypothetical protein